MPDSNKLSVSVNSGLLQRRPDDPNINIVGLCLFSNHGNEGFLDLCVNYWPQNKHSEIRASFLFLFFL